jgi:hypothetical protein
MDADRNAARDYVIRREGDALLAAGRKEPMQFNPECANDILRVEPHPTSSEFGGIYLDDYTEECVADVREQMA